MSQYLTGETRWLKDQSLNRSVPLSVLLHLSDPKAPRSAGGLQLRRPGIRARQRWF